MQATQVAGEGEVLWRPTPAQIEPTRLAAYQRWLAAERGLRFDDYAALWQWSVDDIETFWQTIWDFFDVQADGSCQPVLASHDMPGAAWYPNARLNYAEQVFRHATPPLHPAACVCPRGSHRPLGHCAGLDCHGDHPRARGRAFSTLG